jgi:hypothetical protein
MLVLKLFSALSFILSSGLFFNERFRRNYLAVGAAGILALFSSYILLGPVIHQMVDQRPPTAPSKVVFPDIISLKYSNEPSEKARWDTCFDQYSANSAADNGGLVWSAYHLKCDERLQRGK